MLAKGVRRRLWRRLPVGPVAGLGTRRFCQGRLRRRISPVGWRGRSVEGDVQLPHEVALGIRVRHVLGLPVGLARQDDLEAPP